MNNINQEQNKKSNTKYLLIGVGLFLGLAALLLFMNGKDMRILKSSNEASINDKLEFVNVTACMVINSPGVYDLNKSITADVSPCIDIQSSDVILEGHGFSIDDPSPGAFDLISAIGLDNITINDIKVSNGTKGIIFNGVTNGAITNSTLGDLFSLGDGILAFLSDGNLIQNITGYSKINFAGDNNRFLNNHIDANTATSLTNGALWIGGNNILIDNSTFTSNGGNTNLIQIGGYISSAIPIENITIRNIIANAGAGGATDNYALILAMGYNITIINFTSQYSQPSCVALGGANFFVDGLSCNNVSNSGAWGVFAYTNNSIYRNVSINRVENGIGFWIAAPNITVENITVNASNPTGIYISKDSTDTKIKKVKLFGKALGFDNDVSEFKYAMGSGGATSVSIENYYIENYTIETGNVFSFSHLGKVMINFKNSISGSGENLSYHIKTDKINFSEVRSDLNSGLNVSANITFFNLIGIATATNVSILKDHGVCPVGICSNLTSRNNDPIIVSVTGWTNYSILYVAGAANTCSYTSGNWIVACSDNCTITNNVDVGGNNITISGNGTFKVQANISNYKQLQKGISGRGEMCSIIRTNGGGFKK